MKTAIPSIRPALVLCVAASLTLAAGFTPSNSVAQDGTRTIATGSGIPLAPNAPEEYVVKTGDTLWDISKTFLREPWYWPEIWYVNPQIDNPHLIFPGDVLRLVYIDGQPRLTIGERGDGAVVSGGAKRLSPQVRREPLSRAITAIPYDLIASFMGRPTLLDKDQVKKAPYVVAMRDHHIIGAAGNDIYARRLKDAPVDARYSVVHVQEELRDPENNDLLGYTGMYVGASVVTAAGDPAKLVLTETSREALQGDKLFPETVDVNLDFVPHAPSQQVQASVIAVNSHTLIGQYQIVALNRGARHGLEPGHVLDVAQRGPVVRDRYASGGLARSLGRGTKVELPNERIGTVMVFKAYDRMSYALVMDATHPISQGDIATNP